MNKDQQESPNQKQSEDLQNNTEVADQNGNSQQDDSPAEAEAKQEEEAKQDKKEISETDKLKEELDQSKDKYLRLYSEFENYRRRTAKEKLELVQTANENLMVDLLPILDDFERATKAIGEEKDKKAVKEGLGIIHKKLVKTLEQKGLKGMEDKQGSEFDAEVHEAISRIPVEQKKLKGKIVDVIEKGYKLGDKVIRFAKVVIGS